MPITYIVGPANSSKSTLLESYRKQVPPGVEVIDVGSRLLPQKYIDKANRGAITFFAEHPSPDVMKNLITFEREFPHVQVVVTIEDGGFFSRFIGNVIHQFKG